jgi:carbon storage regulator
MLILSRKVGEKIIIGDGITVVVQRVSGDRVTLGLEAPSNVRILRSELQPFEAEMAKEPALALAAASSAPISHTPAPLASHRRSLLSARVSAPIAPRREKLPRNRLPR